MAARGLKDFGTIEAGKLADLVLLTADPLADIGNLRKIAAVMKDGPHRRSRAAAAVARAVGRAAGRPPGTKDVLKH